MRLSQRFVLTVAAVGLVPLALFHHSESLVAASSGMAFRSLDGRTILTSDPAAKATVAIFLSTQCPISNRSAGAIKAVQQAYAGRNVRFVLVYPNTHESDSEVRASARARGYTMAVVRDRDATVSTALGATVTPEAAVLSPAGKLLYLGPVEENARAEGGHETPMRAVLDEVLAGRTPQTVRRQPLGCLIETPEKAVASSVTYASTVQPILRSQCETCHHDGEATPFSLTNYEQSKSWSKMIKRVTETHVMPPWKPEAGYGSFKNERRLTDAQIKTLATWADAGAPMGNPHKILPPRKFPVGWRLGAPDVVLQPEQTYHLAADGDDVYRCYSMPMTFNTDKWISGIEVQPGNRSVVHHCIVFLDPRGKSAELDAADPEPGYKSEGGGIGVPDAQFLGGWVPGYYAPLLPDGIAMKFPAGARLVLQVHYHKNGVAQDDMTRFGVHFAKAPVHQPLYIMPVLNFRFRLPAGQTNIPVEAVAPVPADVHLRAVIPHMHWLGRHIEAKAVEPDGKDVPLIRINNWDFRWQDAYTLKDPIALPKGSKIVLDAVYDNAGTKDKPAHDVHWGEQTTDEMCLMFAAFTVDGEDLQREKTASR